jgi:hypothetical protein
MGGIMQPALTDRLRRIRASRGGDAGFSILLVALLLTVFMVVTAIVVDLGNARQQKREAQSAADAGALAGAQDLYASPHVPSGCSDANCSAAYYTFNSAQIVPSSAANLLSSRGSCTQETVVSGETCYQYTINGTTVDVKSPYFFNGTADSTMVHVRVCWNAPTTFARVIGTNNVNVCGAATAQNTGSGGGSGGSTTPVADCITEDNFADSNDNPQIYVFNPGDYPDTTHVIDFSKGNAIPKNHTDLVALFDGHGTAIDLSSIVFKAPTTVSGPLGQNATLSQVTPNSNHGPESSNAVGQGYVVQTLDNANKVQTYVAGSTRVLISYQLPDDSHLKVGGKNFVYTATLHVNDTENAGASPPVRCGNADWTFTHDGKNLTSGGSTCGENSFFGFPTEPINGQVVAGTTVVKAFYVDESVIQNHDISDVYWNTHNGVDGGYTLTASDGAHSKDKFNTTIGWKVPSTLANGNYKIYLKAYDTDNNKAGNDCGVGTWTITVTGGTSGSVNLIE